MAVLLWSWITLPRMLGDPERPIAVSPLRTVLFQMLGLPLPDMLDPVSVFCWISGWPPLRVMAAPAFCPANSLRSIRGDPPLLLLPI